MAKKRNTLFNASGLIPNEPTWTDIDSLDESQGQKRLGDMLNFYASEVTKGDLRKDLVEYLKNEHKDLYKKVKGSVDDIPFTAYKIARAVNLGMPVNDKVQESFLQMVKSVLGVSSQIEEEDTKSKTPKVSPLDRLKDKVGELVIVQLESLIDEWTNHPSQDPEEFDLVQHVKNNDIAIQGYRFVYEWIDRYIDEFQTILEGDEYSKESYSFTKKPIVRKWIKSLNKMKSELEKVEGKVKEAKKKQRERRTKKPLNRFALRKQILKKVSKLKYLEEDSETSLKSINPEGLYGKKTLYAYNTKYRQLIKFEAQGREGLDTRGTTVIDMNEALSFKVKLRKPEEVLDLFKKGSVTERKIENALSKITTKKSPNTGRLNENTILLKVFDK